MQKITCAVSIGLREGGGFALAVKMHVEDKSLPEAELVTLVKEAHEKVVLTLMLHEATLKFGLRS